MTQAGKRALATGIVTAALATVIIGILTIGAARQAPVSEPAFVHSYDHRVLHDGLEILIVQSDGQAFASLARDPSLSRPSDFESPAEAAYRWQRPLLSYLAWAGSLGHPGWVPPALMILFVLAAGGSAAGLGALLERRHCPGWPAIGLILLPGTYTALTYFGPELLGLALVVWGTLAWTDPGRRRTLAAIALFGLAGLARETMLLVPVALALLALRKRRASDAATLATSAIPWLLWIVIVHVRSGAWPTDAGQGRLTRPFQGIFDALHHGQASTILPYALLGGLIVLSVVVLCRSDVLTGVVLVHAAFGVFLGERVWIDWQYYSRVLLPLYALGIVAIIGHVLGKSASV